MERVRIVIRWPPVRMNCAIRDAMKRLSCLIGGHTEQIVCRNRTLALHCARGGDPSPGWPLDGKRTTIDDRNDVTEYGRAGSVVPPLSHARLTLSAQPGPCRAGVARPPSVGC